MVYIMTLPVTRNDETHSERLERETIAAMMAAIEHGFNISADNVTVRQVTDACIIVVSFLKSCELAETPRSIEQWRKAVEDLRITLGSTK